MFKYRKEKRDKYIDLVIRMYFDEGASMSAISKKISTPLSTVKD